MKPDELIVALKKCSGIGNNKILKFTSQNNFDFDRCVANLNSLVAIDEFETKLKLATEEINKSKIYGINSLCIFDDEYPKKLLISTDPIVHLYYLGNKAILNMKSIAIIGSRNCSIESQERAKMAAKIAASNNMVVTSGLAKGVDTYAHIGCLEESGRTIAVLPAGLDNVVPYTNKKLAESIIKKGGCLVSEYPIESAVQKFNYPKRDRIQAALSDVILVIEASETSGTMHTVSTAKKENIPVFQLSTNNNSQIKYCIDLSNELDINQLLNAHPSTSKEIQQLSLF